MKTNLSIASSFRIIIIGLATILLLAIVIIPQFRQQAISEESGLQYQKQNGYIFIPENSPLRERIGVDEVIIQVLRTEVKAPAYHGETQYPWKRVFAFLQRGAGSHRGKRALRPGAVFA